MLAAKPRDPRARFAHALTLIDAHDLPGAERELRVGLADGPMLAWLKPPDYEDRIRLVLGRLLDSEKRSDDARAAAAPACAAERTGPLHDQLAGARLCP